MYELVVTDLHSGDTVIIPANDLESTLTGWIDTTDSPEVQEAITKLADLVADGNIPAEAEELEAFLNIRFN